MVNICLENGVNVNYDKIIDINSFTDIYKYKDHRFKEMIKIIKDKNGTTNVTVYVAPRHKFEVTCLKDGYKWTTCYDYLKQGLWCGECSKHRKHTLEKFQEIAIYNDGLCLSTEYKNGTTKMEFECCMKHRWKTEPRNIIIGTWCPTCNKN